MWDYKEFTTRDWILTFLPINYHLLITSTDHWSWLNLNLQLYPFVFKIVIFGYGLEVDFDRPVKHFKLVDERKSYVNVGNFVRWQYFGETKHEPYMKLFDGLRCFRIDLNVAAGWELFNFDLDWHEGFGGIQLLALNLGWNLD